MAVTGAPRGAQATGSLVTVAGHPGVRVEALTADEEVPTPRILAPPLIKFPADLTLVAGRGSAFRSGGS